jgi:PAS domain S-box-containing protein
MTDSKGSSLLIRVSHLILIQIIFIFSALAMVIFYPQNEMTSASQYTQAEQKIIAASSYISDLIKKSDNLDSLSFGTIGGIDAFVKENNFLNNVDLYYYDSVTQIGKIIHLSNKNNIIPVKPETEAASAYELSIVNLLKLNLSDKNYLSLLSENGKQIKYYLKPTGDEKDYVLVLNSSTVLSQEGQNKQAYLLFILFLVSALISLLIINLISKGIKRPLSQLIEAFENIADGRESYLKENGDKLIRSLIGSFNAMSQKLAEKTRELTKSNSQLIKSNKNLVESESILTALVDYSPDAIVVTDLEDQVIIYNLAAARDFGFDHNNMTGKKIHNLIPTISDEDQLDKHIDEQTGMREIICRRRDGVRFPALLVNTPLGPEKNSPIAMLYFIKSISESESYKEMILQLDRIGNRGKMARDIAHEINNYLAVLQGNLELIPMVLAKNETDKVEKKISIMKDTVAKIINFTEGLTRFSDDNSEFRKEDLNQLIENLIAFLKPQNKYDDIIITTNLSENVPLVEIDAGQIQHLLVNLIRNAAEAVQETKNEGRKWIVISTHFDESTEDISIKVADGGAGIPAEHISKLFVKRFSSKKEGTGLGLITCKNIADNHLSEIQYHSSEESSSVFTIILPTKRSSSRETHLDADDDFEHSRVEETALDKS